MLLKEEVYLTFAELLTTAGLWKILVLFWFPVVLLATVIILYTAIRKY